MVKSLGEKQRHHKTIKNITSNELITWSFKPPQREFIRGGYNTHIPVLIFDYFDLMSHFESLYDCAW